MVDEETCVPSQGVGGNGIASEFGDLTGMTRQQVDDFLRGLGAEIKTTQRGYLEYEFADRSRVHIRTDGEVIRTPAPKYASDGRRLNKGLRLDRDGSLVKTLDEFGNQIPGTHNTGEKVRN
ncbi:MAG: hypothetical protein QQW96_06435 [Tychonema bourrellyi B0820]|uniref:Uncharacterized protein n=1 Tax=Tychonema bourrellyi FEM_GT703 TaxID=2040638 RepID=A0A2G4F6R6_9CYAN|nr:hypothetical protein [Tychonema bourrellyi]MDQ2097266.1 hypothetical protein [Tychonema bourrellyi B0820]PHX57439.1 hypothetical protein CP500_000445 [Tychonema bourrellyi FEM_GT703]